METRFDPAKSVANLRKHGVSLELAFQLDDDAALVAEDTSARGEQRFVAIGPIGDELYVLVYTERDNDIRPISLRMAERSERKLYRDAF